MNLPEQPPPDANEPQETSDAALNSQARAIIRSLPTQTETAFWVIVVVFLGTLLIGLVGNFPIYMPPVVLSILVLPVRAVLASPDKELKREDKTTTKQLHDEGILARLQDAIDGNAARSGFRRPIRLVISQEANEMRAAGTWRRHYIFLGGKIARKIAADLDNPQHADKANAVLLHEIGHIANRDVQRISYTRELLYSCITVLPWWMALLTGWIGLSFLAGEAMLNFDIRAIPEADPIVQDVMAPLLELSPEERAEISEKMETLSVGLMLNFVISALWPIAAIALVLWLFFWRQMLRTREYYADHLASVVGGSELAVIKALGRYPVFFRPKPPQPITWTARIKQAINTRWQLIRPRPLALAAPPRRLLNVWSLHPNFIQRKTVLENPLQLFNNWWSVAWSTAILTLAIDVALINPLAFYYLVGYPAHLSAITTFALLSAWMLPFIALKKPFIRPLLLSLGLILGLRWAWLLFNVGFVLLVVFLMPDYALETFNLLALSGTAQMPESLPVAEPAPFILSILPAVFGLQLLQLITIPILLYLYYRLQRLVAGRRSLRLSWGRRHWLLVVALSVAAVTLFLTPLSDLLSGEAANVIQPGRLVSYGVGLLAIVAALVMSIGGARD